MRIKGWMGRADQTAKVKGMFVRPEQVAEIARRHPELGRLRLVVTRDKANSDAMTLQAETAAGDGGLATRSRRRLQRSRSSRAQSTSSRPAACRTTARSSPTSGR